MQHSSEESETILILAADPLDQPPLGLDREVREIQNGLRHSRKHFEVRQQWAVRPKDLRRALLDHHPSYVHFCGHGAGRDGIVFEGQMIKAEALAGLFALFASEVKCVLLNACYSSVQAEAIAEHIEFVVGMNKAIGDSAAIEFASAFYDALGAGESVNFAYSLGCNAIKLAGIPEHLTPQLLTRDSHSSPSYAASLDLRLRPLQYDWDGAPAVSLLYGREAAAETLRSWILDDSCRVVLITGLGGIGKTDLATCVSRGGNRTPNTSDTLAVGIHDRFDFVLWRTLLNAPRPDDFFRDALNFLSGSRRTSRGSFTEVFDGLLECLQGRRCLLILDNVEAVLRPGDSAMRYRDGYEDFGTFFELVARTNHQSCLVLTSREKPRVIADLEGARRPVRSLSLTGLGPAESRRVFSQIASFSGDNDEWHQITKLYDGNPLALELAARHIDQVFGGDLKAFLSGGRPIFADLQQLLDWHLDRLSADETELIYWLALEREPVTFATLYDNLVSYSSRENIASTLQSLQRRIPLERISGQHFSLQPVLMEQVTARFVSQIGSALVDARSKLAQSETNSERHTAVVDLQDLRLLNTHALLKASAKENVRDSQNKLIVDSIIEIAGEPRPLDLSTSLLKLLRIWQESRQGELGYMAGNIFNLLRRVGFNFRNANFSNVSIWQASLEDITLHATDFSFAEFRRSTFRDAFGTIFSIAYSPNGQLVGVGDDNGEVRLLFASNGQLHMRCVGHSDIVWGVAFSPDGKMIASASFDKTIRLWSTTDGHCINVFLGHENWIYAVAFSPDANWLFSVSEDGVCRIWNVSTGVSTKLRSEDLQFIAAVAVSPDGRQIALGGSSPRVNIFERSNLAGPKLLSKHTGRIRALAFSPGGDLLASGAEDHQINLWKPDGNHIATLRGHLGPIRSLSFSATGDLLASASDDHSARLWSIARKECVSYLDAGRGRVWAVNCSPTHRTVATGTEDGLLRQWDLDSSQCLTTLRGYSNKTWSLAFAPDPSLLSAGNEDALVRVWDIRSGELKCEFAGHDSRVWAVACSPNGEFAASASDDLTVRVWDVRLRRCIHVLRGHTDWIRAVAFSPDSQILGSAGEDGRVIVWHCSTGRQLSATQSEIARIFSISFCNSGTQLAFAGSSNTVQIFSVSGNIVTELVGHDGPLNAISAFGNASLATCSEDGSIKIWDQTTWECVATLGADCAIGSLSWVDSQRIITGDADGLLRLWDIDRRTCEAKSKVHHGAVRSLTVNSVGNTVATTGDDGVIRLWSLPSLDPSAFPGPIRPARPYEGMNISGATGLTIAQREALEALGAFSLPSV